MAAKQPQMSGEAFASIAGMSKSQLYDLMSQMKLLIEQNQQQARQILIDNPPLTRALFQAQIMLGMVQSSHVAPNIQQALSQPQPAQAGQSSNAQTSQPLPVQSGFPGPTTSQPLASARQQHPPQPSISLPSASFPPLTFQQQTTPSNPPPSAQQAKGFVNSQVPPISTSQSSQIHNLPPPPAPPHYSILQSHMPPVSSQAQPPLQIPGMFNQSLQPPLPQQPRPPSMQHFPHQLHSQMPHNLGFQQSSAQQLLSQHMFHSGSNPSSFPQGQPPLPNQPPPQQLYQGGSHIGSDYGNQAGTSMHAERGPWLPGLPDKAPGGVQLPGPPPLVSGQMGPGSGGTQPPRPPPLTPEMEKALLQQVMSLTPEQINLLPPEQRHQVIQLQQMLK